MEREEFIETYNLILDDAEAIIFNQQILANVHTQLEHNLLNPLEQDFIYEERYGEKPAEPRTIRHGDVSITTRTLHQTGIGLRDIKGADLLYEIEGEKFGLIQYKRTSSGRVKSDISQLEALIGNCPDVCWNKKLRPIPKNYLPLRLNAFCGCWYCIIHEGEKRYIHACEAETILRGNTTVRIEEFDNSITHTSFLELFSSCRFGAPLKFQPKESDLRPQDYTSVLLENRHLILEVTQRGRWSRS